MHIESLSIRNFKCFGDIPVKISIQPGITGFVGDNGAGKTSALEALKKLFSPNATERLLRKSDVHFKLGEDSHSVTEREVVIDVVFGFSNQEKIPYVFKDLFFTEKDKSLKVRLVLEGRYIKSESYEDDIDVKIYTARTVDDVPFGPEDARKTPFQGKPIRVVKFVYIPAHRDSLQVTHHALKSLLRQIEQSADWDDETKNQSQDFSKKLEKNLKETPSIETITTDLKNFWSSLHDNHYDTNPVISVVATEFEQLIRSLTLRFEKSPGGGQHQLDELSEGQASLLYFALSATIHNLTWKMKEKAPKNLAGFKPFNLEIAPLTLFALEEPENHLAPFYLPRLVKLLKNLIDKGSAQSFVTSHSTSILARIEPQNVRFFRNCRKTLISDITELPFNKKGKEYKFLHQVLLANPEIYFARLVVIGEGDSERIIIPRIADAMGLEMDPSFIAFVSIGGRHAKHLWKITKSLNIPCVTLLDYDLGRHGGGMGRIKDAVQWLSDAGFNNFNANDVPNHNKNDPQKAEEWRERLRSADVFYSYPLDLDMMMLQAYPKAYVMPNSKNKPNGSIEKFVFGKMGKGNTELKPIDKKFNKEDLLKYHSLFNSQSKPSSHYEALSNLEQKKIAPNCPEPLQALIERAKEILTPDIDAQAKK